MRYTKTYVIQHV